jgi:mycoredoxin
MAGIKVYGADWCGATTATREHLEELGIDYEFIDVDTDPAAAKWVKEQNGGKEKKPTVDIGGRVLSTPTDEELDEAIKETGVKI